MKTLAIFNLLIFAAISSFAQELIGDSLAQKINNSRVLATLDSIPTSLPQLPDTLLPKFQKADSLRTEFNTQAGKLKSEYDETMGKIDSEKQRLNSSIDSLQHLSLPTGKYTRKLDSLNTVRTQKVNDLNAKLTDLKSKTTGKLHALDLPPEYKGPVESATKNIDGLSLDQSTLKIPGLDMKGFELPEGHGLDLSNINGLDDLSSKVGEIGKLPSVPKLETPVGDLGNVGEQLKGYQGDLKNITSGNLNDVQNLPKTLENQATKIDGVAELQKQSGVIDGYKDKLEMVKDPSASKDKALEMAKQAAVDHFAGKEEQLKAAMNQMSKYKQKYSSVASLKDLPKRPPNAMKGKPFIERLIPGFYFQFQQKQFNLYDINPYAGYRISGRFTAGAGWNQRFAYDRKRNEWTSKARIYGPRAFVDFSIGKGFIAHVESEMMNTFVPNQLRVPTFDNGHREWVWAMMTGMKREYKIYKNLRGTVLIQYNLFNPKFKAPYVDRLNSRIGFEYQLRRKKPKAKS